MHGGDHFEVWNEDGQWIGGARREYYLKSLEGPYIMTIDYCHLCGTQLPCSLRTVWGKIIRNELGFNPNNPDDRALAPEEFFSEAWWKKRNL